MKKIVFTAFCLLCLVSVAKGASVGQIAAVVNGDMISHFDVQQAALPEIKKSGLDFKKTSDQEKIRQIYNQTLENMILEILILAEAKKYQVTASDDEVDAEISRIMQQSRMSKEAFEKHIAKEGLNPNSLRLKIHNTILRQKLMGMMVGRKIVLQPEEISNYYEAHRHELKNSKQTQLALLVYPDNVNAENYANQIKKDGKKFEEIARKISIGPNKENGGHLGNVPFDKLDPKLAKFLKSLKEGESTQIIVLNGKRSQFKLVQAASEGELMTFEEAKPMIEGILREPLLKERFEEYISQLRKKAMIDIRM